MQKTGRNEHRRHPSAPPRVNGQPLTDQRFQELLHNASAFFACAEGYTDAERQQVIQEIQAQMRAFGLSAADLV